METIRGWKEKNVSLLAARCHPYHFLVPMLICRKTVPGGHDIVSLDRKLRTKTFFLCKICAYNFNKLRAHNIRQRGKSAPNLAFEG